MIEAFRLCFLQNRFSTERDGVNFNLLPGSEGLPKNGISAVLKSKRFEATVELWETGESEFYFLDRDTADRDPNYQVEVIHHDFETAEQLTAALDQLVSRLSPVLAYH